MPAAIFGNVLSTKLKTGWEHSLRKTIIEKYHNYLYFIWTMKSFLSIFLICYFSLAALVPRMDFDQINTIPDLIAHFFDHEEDGESRSFVKFLDDHYGNESEKPADGHELPFQEHDCCVACLNVASFLPDITRSLASELPPTDLLDTYTFHFTSKHISDIWQPPRA